MMQKEKLIRWSLVVMVAVNAVLAFAEGGAATDVAEPRGVCACTPGPPGQPPEAFCLIGMSEDCNDDDQCTNDWCL